MLMMGICGYPQAAPKAAAMNGHHPGDELEMAHVNGADKASNGAAADIEMGSGMMNGGHERTNGVASTSAVPNADAPVSPKRQILPRLQDSMGSLSRLPKKLGEPGAMRFDALHSCHAIVSLCNPVRTCKRLMV